MHGHRPGRAPRPPSIRRQRRACSSTQGTLRNCRQARQAGAVGSRAWPLAVVAQTGGLQRMVGIRTPARRSSRRFAVNHRMRRTGRRRRRSGPSRGCGPGRCADAAAARATPLQGQRLHRVGRHVLELGGDGVAIARPSAPGPRILVAGGTWWWLTSPAGLACIRIQHGGGIAHALRGVHEHAPELAAAHHPSVTGRRRQPGREPVSGRSRRAGRAGGGTHHRPCGFGLARRKASRRASAGPGRAGQHGHGEQRRVGRAGRADGEGGHRHALGHLHDAVQRIHALQVAAGTGTPSTGTVVWTASMPGRWAARRRRR